MPKRLLAVAACAAVLVTGAIIVSSSSSKPSAPETSGRLTGVTERQGVLGDADAPITVTEYLDPQCPVCAAASEQILPTLVDDYVKTGKVKLDARVLHFLGPDSGIAARYADGAREQDRLWPFLEAFFAAQGTENTGYVTQDFLAKVAAASGVDHERALEHDGQAALDKADAEAQKLGVTGTPTFAVTRNGSTSIVGADRLFAELDK